jgi:hypothetical protein
MPYYQVLAIVAASLYSRVLSQERGPHRAMQSAFKDAEEFLQAAKKFADQEDL